MSTNSPTINVEGWRHIPHSYAIASSFEMLELLRRPNIQLRHLDIPYFHPKWTPVSGLYDPTSEASLRSIPPPQPGERPDAVYRITFPFNFKPSAGKRTLVFGTSEYRCIPNDYISGEQPLSKAMSESECVVVTCSEWSRQGFLASGADPSRVVNIGLGFDPTLFHPVEPDERASLRKEMGVEEFTFLSLGAMTGNKGMEMFLKAFAQVARKHPRVRVLMKGLGALYTSRDFLAQATKSLSQAEASIIAERINFLDSTFTFPQMASLYQAMDAYVSPYHAEGFNMPVLEAAACGMPVICTQGGSTDDFTRPDFALPLESAEIPVNLPGGVNGTALQPNLDQLIQHMLRLVEDPAFIATAYREGPSFVSSSFTWKHVVDRLLKVMLPG